MKTKAWHQDATHLTGMSIGILRLYGLDKM